MHGLGGVGALHHEVVLAAVLARREEADRGRGLDVLDDPSRARGKLGLAPTVAVPVVVVAVASSSSSVVVVAAVASSSAVSVMSRATIGRSRSWSRSWGSRSPGTREEAVVLRTQ